MRISEGMPVSEALNQVFESASQRAIQDSTIASHAARPGGKPLDDEQLRQELRDHRPELMGVAVGSAQRVAQVLRASERLRDHEPSWAASSPLGSARAGSGRPGTGDAPKGLRGLAMKAVGNTVRESGLAEVWQNAADQAATALEAALVERAMIPQLRQFINEERRKDQILEWTHGRDLAPATVDQLYASQGATQRDAGEPRRGFYKSRLLGELGALIKRTRQGSIGIAGPRGSGKSTAIENVGELLEVADPMDLFFVKTDAPSEYVPHDFLTHLLERTCLEWLVKSPSIAASPGPDETSRRRSRSIAMNVTGVAALVAILGVVLLIAAVSAEGVNDLATTLPLLAVLLAVAGAALTGSQLGASGGWESAAGSGAAEWSQQGGSDVGFFWRMTRLRALRGRLLRLAGLLVAAAALLALHAVGLWEWLGTRQLVALLIVGAAACLLVELRHDPPRHWSLWGFLAPALTTGAVLLACLGAGLFLPRSAWQISSALVVGGLLLATATCTLVFVAAYLARQQLWNSTPSEARAREYLRRIRFHRTSDRERRAGLRAGPLAWFGAEASFSAATSDAETPLTAPQLVTMMRDLLRDIWRDESARRNEGTEAEGAFRIVIGIDELDRLEGTDGARNFLNEIKALFAGAPATFLVSVSEEAMVSFERRGLADRDVFDSAFDEIFHLPQLALAGTHELFDARVKDMPLSFMSLAHCLSGGLIRDAIRAVGQMGTCETGWTLECVTSHVVHRELRGKWQAVVAAARPIALEPHVTNLLRALYQVDRCSGSVSENERCLLREEALEEIAGVDMPTVAESDVADLRLLQRLGGEFAGFSYFCLTLLQFFRRDDDGLARLRAAELENSLEFSSLDFLARSRRELGLNPRLAWEQVSDFRRAHALDVVEFPASLRPDGGTQAGGQAGGRVDAGTGRGGPQGGPPQQSRPPEAEMPGAREHRREASDAVEERQGSVDES